MKKSNPYSRFDGVDPAQQALDMYGTRLHSAASQGDLAEVEAVLLNGAYDPNHGNHMGMPPLALSASSGSLECVLALLKDPRVQPNALDFSGRNALIVAAEFGHLSCVQALSKACRLDQKSTDDLGVNALQSAAFNKHLPVVKYLSGLIDPRARNANNESALTLAAESGDVGCVRFLMQLDDPLLLDNLGQNILMRAARHGRRQIVTEIARFFDVEQKDFKGQTALDLTLKALADNWSDDLESLSETRDFLKTYAHCKREMSTLFDATPSEPKKGAAVVARI